MLWWIFSDFKDNLQSQCMKKVNSVSFPFISLIMRKQHKNFLFSIYSIKIMSSSSSSIWDGELSSLSKFRFIFRFLMLFHIWQAFAKGNSATFGPSILAIINAFRVFGDILFLSLVLISFSLLKPLSQSVREKMKTLKIAATTGPNL